jgi:hypothetical protein
MIRQIPLSLGCALDKFLGEFVDRLPKDRGVLILEPRFSEILVLIAITRRIAASGEFFGSSQSPGTVRQ